VRRAYKFRIYPTSGQVGRMVRCLRDHQRLYNAALEERREAWKRRQVSIRYGQQSAQLRDIRAFDPDQGCWSFSSQQATLRRLDTAMAAFYRRCKAGQKAGYPRFRALDRWDSVTWPSDGDGCRWKPEVGRVYLQGVGHVKVHAHRTAAGRVKTITLKREGRRWYLVLSCDDVPGRPLPATGRQVGIDVGVARFATTSDGEVIASRRRAKAALGEVHRRIRNRRRDFHHKTARALVRSCDAIAIEDLKITNMTRSASGTLDQPGTNVAAKSGLNRSILDAGWGQFARILAAKAEEAGRRIVRVDARNTSITCHQCGARCLRPRQALVICPVHGGMDADVNGARNILARAGLGSGQAHAA
jgi:putative transposase